MSFHIYMLISIKEEGLWDKELVARTHENTKICMVRRTEQQVYQNVLFRYAVCQQCEWKHYIKHYPNAIAVTLLGRFVSLVWMICEYVRIRFEIYCDSWSSVTSANNEAGGLMQLQMLHTYWPLDWWTAFITLPYNTVQFDFSFCMHSFAPEKWFSFSLHFKDPQFDMH